MHTGETLMHKNGLRLGCGLAVIAIAAAFWLPAAAENAVTVVITIKNHRFQPSQYRAPANRAVTLRIRNQDPTPMEFESVSLRVEKVVAGNAQGTINLRPLSPGRYNFFDDFNQQAKGSLIVE